MNSILFEHSFTLILLYDKYNARHIQINDGKCFCIFPCLIFKYNTEGIFVFLNKNKKYIIYIKH
jgi:hypothetical protein